MANEAEQAIYTRLASAPTFHPATADIFATDWGLDAGDVVAVRSGNDTYNVPVYNMSLNWKGNSRVQIQSTGNETRKPLSALKRRQYGGGSSARQQIEEQGNVIETRFIQDETKIGFVVEEKEGDLVVNGAHVVAGINNQDKESASYVDIEAQYINLTGYVRASEIDADIATIRQLKSESGYTGSLRVTGAMSAGTVQASNITGSTISASSFKIAGDPATTLSLKTITLPRSGGYNTLSVLGYGDAINFPNCIISASVDETTNTLTLTPLVGTPINFSKAASPENGTITNIVQSAAASYTPTASGGYYTVHASASGTNLTNAGNKYDKDLIVMATAAYQAGEASTTAYQDGMAAGEAKFVQATVTPQGASAGTVYLRKTGGSIRVGSSQTIHQRGTAIYFKSHPRTETPTSLWYSMVGSATEATQTYYTSGSDITAYPTSSSGTYYYLGDGSRSDLFLAGTPDSTTYYTKQSS